ncbi:MAG: right-handed parallel beta-helix repeat-containing protein [Thermoplasmata archaeon]|nr:right-handed parallel beta-helix repeat-containing protein [Thermoplasmata archaeon]
MVGLCLALTVGHTEGATWVVDDSGAWADFHALQDAIDSASVNDTIRVYEGLYAEAVVVNRTLIIEGNGSALSVLDPGGSGAALIVEAHDVNISRLGMAGGVASQPSAAVLIDGADRVSMNECRVEGNVANGLYVRESGRLTVRDSVIVTTVLNGVVLSSSTRARLESIEMEDRGILMTGTSRDHHDTHSIIDCSVGGKPLFYSAGGEAVVVPGDVGQVVVAGCQFVLVKNITFSGGNIAVHASFCNGVGVEGCSIGGMASGVFSYMSTNTTVDDCTIADCAYGVELSTGSHMARVRDTVVQDCQSGIYVLSSDAVSVSRATVSGCSIGIDVRLGCGDITVSDSEVLNCTSGIRQDNGDGGTFTGCDVSGSAGAAFDLEMVEGTHIVDCTIEGNDGAGIHVTDGTLVRLERLVVSSSGATGICVDGAGCVVESCAVRNGSTDGVCLSGIGNNLYNSSILSNAVSGVSLSGEDHVVRWCDVRGNYQGVVLAVKTQRVTVSHNDIAESDDYGLLVSSQCANYTIFRNVFDDNGGATSQGFDVSGAGRWDDGSRGNWWSGFNATNEDGNPLVWDEPYAIDGPGGASDRYPLVGEGAALEFSIELDSTAPLAGMEVTVFVIVDTGIDLGESTVSVYLDEALFLRETRDLGAGRHSIKGTWEAQKGFHTFRAVLVTTGDGGEDTLTVEVVDTQTTDHTIKFIPDAAVAFLAVVIALLIMFNVRRPFFKLLKHERK